MESLLTAHAQAGSFIVAPAAGVPFVGRQIGAYTIQGALGAGGMGEVYRARDGTLGRDVAIKILPRVFSTDPDRRARFDREARLLAALNHPHIGAIYGVEDSDGVRALVLELVEGDTLADRLARGPIPVSEALPIARQIADALDAAHEKGIVHRDLKPANIKITPEGVVKVLDFGVAKAALGDASGPDLTRSPTVTIDGTREGVILGTAAYMSPEQARGKPVDKRADIWAFGCVLYEMLTGCAVVTGETLSDMLAAILEREPDWQALPSATPGKIQDLLWRCLQKDPHRRLRDIGDARLEIDDAIAAPIHPGVGAPVAAVGTPRRSLWKRAMPIAATAIVVMTVAGAAWWGFTSSVPPLPVRRFSVQLPEGQQLRSYSGFPTVAMSPDDTKLVYLANFTPYLWLRSQRQDEARPIPSNEQDDMDGPAVFSPDGGSLAFWSQVGLAGFRLKTMAVGGGVAVPMCLAGLPLGMSWGADGIVFGQRGRGIMRVSPSGTCDLIVPVKPGEDALSPQILPGGEAVLFTLATGSTAARWDTAQIVVKSLKSGETKKLPLAGGSDARYIPKTGHLVYAVRGAIYAIRFDVRRLEVIPPAVKVIDGVRVFAGAIGPFSLSTGLADFSVSDTGTLAYVPGAGLAPLRKLVFVDPKGVAQPLELPQAAYQSPRISRDGSQIAYVTDDGHEANVWIYDVSGAHSPRQLTLQGKNRFPIWSNDGQRVAYQSDREGDLGIFWQRADGSDKPVRLTRPEAGEAHIPESWPRAGRYFSFSVVKGSNASLSVFSLQDMTATPVDGVRSQYPLNSAFSPDGRWLAYTVRGNPDSDFGLWVEPYPATGVKYPITSGEPGHHAFWSADGAQLFYHVGGNPPLLAVDITTQPSFLVSNPTQVAGSIRTRNGFDSPTNLDVAPYDKRIINVVESEEGSEIEFVLNWHEELKRLVPVR